MSLKGILYRVTESCDSVGKGSLGILSKDIAFYILYLEMVKDILGNGFFSFSPEIFKGLVFFELFKV